MGIIPVPIPFSLVINITHNTLSLTPSFNWLGTPSFACNWVQPCYKRYAYEQKKFHQTMGIKKEERGKGKVAKTIKQPIISYTHFPHVERYTTKKIWYMAKQGP